MHIEAPALSYTVRIAKRFLITVGFGYLAILGALYAFQHKIIFHPTKLRADHHFSFNSNFEDHFLKTPSGVSLNYLIFRPEQVKGVMLYFHGNAGSLANAGFLTELLAEKTGMEVWAIDYPGFGKSGEELPFSHEPFFEAADAIYAEAKKKRPTLSIYTYGYSLGSAMATHIATTHKTAGVVLESPYYSIEEMAHKNYPWAPTFLVRYRFDNTKIKSSKTDNILIIHGRRDQVIPFQHSERLAQMTNVPNSLVRIEDGQHDNLSHFPAYWSAIDAFFNRAAE